MGIPPGALSLARGDERVGAPLDEHRGFVVGPQLAALQAPPGAGAGEDDAGAPVFVDPAKPSWKGGGAGRGISPIYR